VKQERLPWLAENPHYTRRFARYVGKLCRGSSLTEVAADLRLDWHAVKAMDMAYMQEQLERAGPPAPRVIGIDEISIRKGHVYRIIVSDLEVGRPIWFGGVDRSDASMAQFYTELGPTRCQAVEVAVMDMWRAFRTATERHAPQAAILYDKFHVLRQLGEAMDQVRKAEYKANKRLHTAYVLKEQFGQLWEYRRVAWARKFFETWRRALRWQRLAPFEQFAALIERHWDGIAAYCEPDNKVALGFVEGLNNKVRVIQRRCYGIRDEQYLRLKVLTCTLPPLPREENG
jgi:transposase